MILLKDGLGRPDFAEHSSQTEHQLHIVDLLWSGFALNCSKLVICFFNLFIIATIFFSILYNCLSVWEIVMFVLCLRECHIKLISPTSLKFCFTPIWYKANWKLFFSCE